jgi:nucleotide-binding universal stress UspA family protein
MAQLPGAQFTLLSIATRPHETVRVPVPLRTTLAGVGSTPITIPVSEPLLVEDREEAIERTLAERVSYLKDIVRRLPPGPAYSTEAVIADDVGAAIIQYVLQHRPNVIVMGTHGETGMIHRLFGDVAEEVVRSGVAPVLLVHSNAGRRT